MPEEAPTMQVHAELAAGKVTLALADREATRRFFADVRQQLGFMIPLPERPKPFATINFQITDRGGFELGLQARVVQIFERGASLLVACMLLEWSEARDREVERKLEAVAQAPAAASAPATAAGEPEVANESEHSGASPVFRIKQLDPASKARLAMKADRAERAILCRDTSPQILLSLLSNPRIETEEVLAIVRSTHATAAIMERVAQERRWMSSSEVRTAVVRNPKTPPPLAVRLLDTLPLTELREMARMGSLREDVRRAAFRVYEKLASRR